VVSTRTPGLRNHRTRAAGDPRRPAGRPPGECHPLCQQTGRLAHARRHDYWLVAYAPLARNAVAGEPEIRAVAEKHDATPAQCIARVGALEDEVVARELDGADVARVDGIER
jgi:hypothetical protein